MGRKRVKKTCTSCRFNHNEAEKTCDVTKAVEEELSEIPEDLIGAVGGEPAPETVSTTPEPGSNRSLRIPDQTALNELASLENRKNSRMEKFEAVIVNLVSGLSIPSKPTVSAEKKGDTVTVTAMQEPKQSDRRHAWGGSDTSDSDNEVESNTNKEKKK